MDIATYNSEEDYAVLLDKHQIMQVKCTRYNYTDFNVPCLTLAKNLLGMQLCRRIDSGQVVKGLIVETECYLGGDDRASHSFAGKMTERNAAMYMKPGTAYVYSTYGMYHCLNISSKGDGAAVLIRALQPTFGIDTIQQNRLKNRRGRGKRSKDDQSTSIRDADLCNGPAKLCMSFEIDKSLNKMDMVDSMILWVERPDCQDNSKEIATAVEVVACSRIGIEYAGKEWASKPFRFYIIGNPCVSKRDRKVEETFRST